MNIIDLYYLCINYFYVTIIVKCHSDARGSDVKKYFDVNKTKSAIFLILITNVLNKIQ